jgi:O-antigen/teichoic acid export membrane protein
MFSPVMFAYYGPVVAGQMGMTLAAIRGAQMLGSVWIDTKVAEFGILIARRDFVRLDRLFWRRTQASLLVVALASGGLVSLLIMLRALKHPFALRLLGPGPTALLLAGTLMSQVGVCLSSYLRAHKREPLAVVSVATGMMTGSAVWLLGRRFGPLGAAAGSAGTWIVSTVWVWRIFLHSRREWHADVTPAAAVTPR